MANIEKFLDFWSSKDVIGHEKSLCTAYLDGQKQLEQEHSRIMHCLDCQEKNDQLIAVFSNDARGFIDNYNSAKMRFAIIKEDIESFCKLTDGEPDLVMLANQIHRTKRQIQSADHDANIAVQRAIRDGSPDVRSAENSEVVQSAYNVRDNVHESLDSVLVGLQDRLKKAHEILNKY